MAKTSEPPVIYGGADNRPRVYMRVRGNEMQVAGNPNGPWTVATDFFDALDDAVGVPGAWTRRAVILWEGKSTDA